MAYFVYPSNKTSRFIHSVGVCYIASLIYKNALDNASNETVKKFFEDKQKFLNESSELREKIKTLLKKVYGARYKRIFEKLFPKDHKINFEFLFPYLEEIVGRDFINYFCLNSYNKNFDFINIILLQSLRFFALLHDYGHLPFSHLFEFAIDEVFEEISEKGDIKTNNPEFYKKLEFLLEQEDHIHEIIGKKLSIFTLRHLQHEFKIEDNIEKEAAIKIIFEIIIYILNELYKGKESHFYSLYKIVSGELDADRMDYTIRDLVASGLKYQYDIDRIIKNFYLTEIENKEEYNPLMDKFKFVPSIRALYDIESLYVDRNNLYKMVINHHKVKKYDSFLQKAIKINLIEEIKQFDNIDNLMKDDKIIITDLVDVLFTILELTSLEDGLYDGETSISLYKFSQLTDYWLLSFLRNKLISNLIENKEKTFSYKIIEEIFNGTKQFKSLFKREFEFENFWKEILNKIDYLNEEDILYCLKNNKFEKKLENEGIYIVYTKTPSTPQQLTFINTDNNKIFDYNFKQKVSEFSIKFFVYYHSKKFSKEEVKENIKQQILNIADDCKKGD